ncbi:hypothetical protein DW044_15970 [Lachnospira eligens]|nr:hypothetical protein DW044_15970 [Lachnospira eligens]
MQTGIVAHSHWIGGSFECRLFIYSYFCENNSKLTKFDYVGDWLSKFVTGIITGLLNVSIYAGVIEKFIYKNNAIIDVAIMMVMVIVLYVEQYLYCNFWQKNINIRNFVQLLFLLR